MRLAAITDVHGNRFALDAVLASIAKESVDQFVCLGDLALLGPDPAGSLDRIMALNCPVVRGNTDDMLVQGVTTSFTDSPDGQIRREIGEWTIAQLTDSHRAFLKEQLVPSVELDLAGLAVCAYHGSPVSYNDPILPGTPDADLETWFAGIDAPILIGGHTHRQLLRRWNGRTVVNPGPVSLSFERLPFSNGAARPWAEYALITNDQGDIRVEFRYVPIDMPAFFADARASNMPHVEWWLSGWE